MLGRHKGSRPRLLPSGRLRVLPAGYADLQAHPQRSYILDRPRCHAVGRLWQPLARHTQMLRLVRSGRVALKGSVDRAYHDAMAESIVSTFDAELLSRRGFASRVVARMACFLDIEGRKNPVSLNSSLGYWTPMTYDAVNGGCFDEAVARKPCKLFTTMSQHSSRQFNYLETIHAATDDHTHFYHYDLAANSVDAPSIPGDWRGP